MSVPEGRDLYTTRHPPRGTATTGAPREWTMEDLLANPADQGRCLWESHHGNTHPRRALDDLRQSIAGATAEAEAEAEADG